MLVIKALGWLTTPIPFSFRHTDVLKVETIATDGTATAKTISTHYDVVQLATANISGDSNVISSNSQRTEYGWIKYKVATTDVIHIYREETFLQDYNYVDSTVIPAEQFTKSADRIVDAMSTQFTRDTSDPSAFDAQGRKVSGLKTPVRHDDVLTKTVLDSMGTTASLAIPASGGSGDNGKLLCPSAFAPGSTPAVAWASRLGLPDGGATSLYVLSPVSDYANTPFVEWTLPRWITAPPDDGLRSVYSYGTSSYVEGEGTTKTARWRQFREMLTTPTTTADVNKVIRLKSTTWSPPTTPTAFFPSGSYEYEMPTEPSEGTELTRDLRMVALDDSNIGYSPRMKLTATTFNVHFDGSLSSPNDFAFGDGDGTYGTGSAEIKRIHPFNYFEFAHGLKNDSDANVMPQMIFMQVKTNGYTVPQSGAYGSSGIRSGHTAYPVYIPRIHTIDNREDSTPSEFMLDYSESLYASEPWYSSDDGTAHNTIAGTISMANVNALSRDESHTGTNESHYLDFTTAQAVTIHFLCVYGTTGGIK